MQPDPQQQHNPKPLLLTHLHHLPTCPPPYSLPSLQPPTLTRTHPSSPQTQYRWAGDNGECSLLAYRYHYLRDVESNFPEVSLGQFMVCPRLRAGDWGLGHGREGYKQYKQQQQQKEVSVPIFYNPSQPQQYFQQQCHLLGLVLCSEGSYYGYLGYIPGTLPLLSIILALAHYHRLTLSLHNHYCMSHITGQQCRLDQLRGRTVREYSQHYLKVYQMGNILNEEHRSQGGREGRDGQNGEDLMDFLNEDKQGQDSVPNILANQDKRDEDRQLQQLAYVLLNDSVDIYQYYQNEDKHVHLPYPLITPKHPQQVTQLRSTLKQQSLAPSIALPHKQSLPQILEQLLHRVPP